MFLSCKSHFSSHQESTWNTEEATPDGTGFKSELKNFLSRTLNIHCCNTGNKSETETSENVSEKDKEQISHLILLNKTSCSSVELELVTYN